MRGHSQKAASKGTHPSQRPIFSSSVGPQRPCLAQGWVWGRDGTLQLIGPAFAIQPVRRGFSAGNLAALLSPGTPSSPRSATTADERSVGLRAAEV